MSEPTPCETCANVTDRTRKKEFWKWTCIKFPRLQGLNPVAPHEGLKHEPYNYCTKINLGFCPLYEPRREGPEHAAD